MANIAQLLTEHMDIWTAADTEKKSGRGRVNGNAGNVYGVKKLRELILELAVRGKLVPQDPNDEPASELLKRIQAEKAKLIAEGKLKKEKTLTPIDEDEKPFELPNGWILVRNSELFQLRKGRIPKILNEEGLGLPYLDIEALDRNVVRRYSEETTCPQSTENDILVVCDGSRSGLVLDGKNGIIGSTLSIIDAPVFIQNYIKLIFKQCFERFNTSMKGAAIPHLDTQNLLQNLTALPPLGEQYRIVAKVDELMALCDQLEQQHSNAQEAHENLVNQLLATLTQSKNAAEFNTNWQRICAHFDTLFTTEASIDTLKQTLLQLAVMGKLVPQDMNDEPASALIHQAIIAKKAFLSTGKTKKEKVISSDVKPIPFNLPGNWCWTKLNNLIFDLRYGTSVKCSYESDGIPVLRIPNIGNNVVSLEDLKYGKLSEEEQKSLKLEIGDALLIRSNGSESLVGKSALVTEEALDCAFAGYLVRLRLMQMQILPKYFLIVMKTPDIRVCIEGPLRTTSGVKNINGTEISNLRIPLPPFAEQQRIVSKVDELMALCDQLKTRIITTKQLQQELAVVMVENAIAQ